MNNLSAMYQSILTIDDNTEDNDILDLSKLRAKNKIRHRRQSREIRRLYDNMMHEREDSTVKLALKASIITIATTSARDRDIKKSY